MTRATATKRPAGRRAQKKAETERRIALAGRKLIRSKGFDAVTTQEVAIEAGIPPGTLFGYIDTKNDLLIIALVHEAMEFVATIGPRVPAGTFIERVEFVLNEMADYHGNDFELSRHFLRELAITRNPQLAERAYALGDAVRAVIARIAKEHQQRGEVTSAVDADTIARLVFSHYWNSLRLWINGVRTRQDYSRMIKEALFWQFTGLAARPSAAPAVAATRRK